jgi:hypothetical protein
MRRFTRYIRMAFTWVMAILTSVFRRFENFRTPAPVWDDPTLRAPEPDERGARPTRLMSRGIGSDPKRA